MGTITETAKQILLGKSVRTLADIILSPLSILAAGWSRYFRSRDVNQMPLAKRIFMRAGVFPINDHYFEPLFNTRKYLRKSLAADRNLPGIDFRTEEQQKLLSSFHYATELVAFPEHTKKKLTYYYKNGSYPAGDGELLYSMVRHFRPERIIEVGCGFSTLMIRNAVLKNEGEYGDKCSHICIEPYEMNWLEELRIEVKREKVEDIDMQFFKELRENDILFIDSTHMIKPQGDVLFEILEILPELSSGVVVHFHDIFTPKDYPREWVEDLNRFWNEQYLLEAFLSNNRDFKIILAANYLRHHFPEEFFAACPVLKREGIREPGSLWIQKV